MNIVKSLIKGKSYLCTVCGKAPGNGCVLYMVGVSMAPKLCVCDSTLEAKFVDQTDMVKKRFG